MLGICGTSCSRYFHTVSHYSVFLHQNQPPFEKIFFSQEFVIRREELGVRISFGKRLTPNSSFLTLKAVKPHFLHKDFPVVKNTTREKVDNPSNTVGSFYVNPHTFSTACRACGKSLWKNLLRMWKTMSYQQVFSLFPVCVLPVEKSDFRFA